MCGISGILKTNYLDERDLSLLKEMNAIQAHRGPDDTKEAFIPDDGESPVFCSNHLLSAGTLKSHVALGFNRLAIRGSRPTHMQPMESSCGRYVLAFNGEIYNCDWMLARLNNWLGGCENDSEVFLQYLSENGVVCALNAANGIFAIAVYDKKDKAMYLCRDKWGVKPLYLGYCEGGVCIASEIKALNIHSGKRVRSRTQLCEYLLYRNVANETLFSGVSLIEPGAVILLSPGNLSAKKVSDLKQTFYSRCGKYKHDSRDVGAILRDAVARQLVSDAPVGVQLSGGVDSGLIAAYATEHYGKNELKSYSVVFDDDFCSEEKQIDRVSKRLGLKGNKIIFTDDDVVDWIDDVTWHLEEPLAHPNTIGIYLVNKVASKDVKVLLSGEGADELFYGYEHMRRSTYSKARKEVAALYGYFRTTRNFPLMSCLRCLHYLLKFPQARVVPPALLSSWLNEIFYCRIVETRKNKFSNEASCRDVLRSHELITYLRPLLLRQDKMSMAHSVENRVPFLDDRVVEHSLSLSRGAIGDLRKSATGKEMLRKLLKSKVPEWKDDEVKNGFRLPEQRVMNSQKIKQYTNDVTIPALEGRLNFNPKDLGLLYARQGVFNKSEAKLAWSLMSLASWAAVFDVYVQDV